MADRFTPSAAALTTVVLLIVIAGAELRAKRHHAPTPAPPQLDVPQPIERPWLYVHCAANEYGVDNPCALDPAMRRLNVKPIPVPVPGPGFAPAR